MSKSIHWSITDQNVIVNYDGETHIVPRTDALADRLIKAMKEGRKHEIPSLVSAAKRIEVFSKGNFVVKDGRVMVNGVAAPKVLSDKIIKFSNEGLPFQPLVKFAENLQKNPSFRAVNELFGFLEKNDHPLTESGNFIAYKRVRGNFLDIYSGTIDNSVGSTPEVPRNQVDEDSSRTCSHGLHVANWHYAHTQYGTQGPTSTDVMLEVEVNPADVVAIPTDYNNAKMRCCKYKVLGVVTTPFVEGTNLRVVDPSYVPPSDLDEEEEDNEVCADCECEVCECDYCDWCDCNPCECEEEVEDTCDVCGTVLNDDEYEVCRDCEEEEEDKYPYDDELDDLDEEE